MEWNLFYMIIALIFFPIGLLIIFITSAFIIKKARPNKLKKVLDLTQEE